MTALDYRAYQRTVYAARVFALGLFIGGFGTMIPILIMLTPEARDSISCKVFGP